MKKEKPIVTIEEIRNELSLHGLESVIAEWWDWNSCLVEDAVLGRDLIQAQKLYDKIAKRLGYE
jgi:hypothetical protein